MTNIQEMNEKELEIMAKAISEKFGISFKTKHIDNVNGVDFFAVTVHKDGMGMCETAPSYADALMLGISFCISTYHIPSPTKVRYFWDCTCSDCGYTNESEKLFVTEKECYNDMRNAVLEKMKWNTEYDEDLADMDDNEYIGYHVHFHKSYITHLSYSGKYKYVIHKVFVW